MFKKIVLPHVRGLKQLTLKQDWKIHKIKDIYRLLQDRIEDRIKTIILYFKEH